MATDVSRKAVGLTVALLVAGLLVAFLFPSVIGAISGPSEATVTQDIDETVLLSSPDLEATVTETTDGTDATYTIETDTDSVVGETVNVGESSTVTVDGHDVTISPTEATATGATTDYEYPTTYGWGTGASSLWSILPLFIVLVPFLLFVHFALRD